MEHGAPLEGAAHVAQRVSGGAFSATGSQRKNNEDAFGLPPAGAPQARYGTLVALADGVGGRPGGAVASRAAVYFLQALYYAPLGPRDPGARLRHCFEFVNTLNRVTLKSDRPQDQDQPQALTTLVAAVAFNERLWVANVGDSRAYHARGRDRQLQRLTEDHSQAAPPAARGPAPLAAGTVATGAVAAGAVSAGVVSAGAVSATQPLASAPLTHAIGLDDLCQVDVYAYTWEPGDRLLLASDGLRALPEGELAPLALGGSPKEAARALVTEALERDDADNVTVVVLAWAPAGRRPVREAAPMPGPDAPRRGLVPLTVAAGVLGLLLGWASALAAFLYFGGLSWLR